MTTISRGRADLRAALAALAFTLPAAARAAQVPANADAFQTLPGAASVTLPGIGAVPLEGAEFSAPGTDPFYPLTAAEVTRLNTLAPNLGLEHRNSASATFGALVMAFVLFAVPVAGGAFFIKVLIELSGRGLTSSRLTPTGHHTCPGV